MSKIDQRKLWRKRWLESFNELTDLELQKKSWLDFSNSTNPHWSFIEFMCCYFDDLAISDYKYEQFIDDGWVSNEEYSLIKKWHFELDNYNTPNGDDYNHDAILSDKKWLEIVAMGSAAKANLSLIILKDEKKHLSKLEYVT